MAKDRMKNQSPEKSDGLTKLESMLEVGNVFAAQKFGASMLKESGANEQERELLKKLLKGIVPEALVFWIGVGSVAVAKALAFWLLR